MYCASCGTQLADGLSYCNRCGVNLRTKAPGQAETTETTTDTLVWVIVGTTITLLGLALGALVLMKNGSIAPGLGTAFVVLSFVSLLLVEGVLVWRLLRLNQRDQKTQTFPEPKDLSTEELKPVAARTLHEAAEPLRSVTEQTTRDLEPSYREGQQR